MVQEIWVDVPNYEGHYLVSNLGRIRSKKYGKIKDMILHRHPAGNTIYQTVNFSRNNIQKRFLVSRIVSCAFLGLNINDLKVFVCHKNDNGSDNRADNLFLGTAKDNTHDAIKKGRLNNSGENNGMVKFTDAQVFKMREMMSNGINIKDISKEFNISISRLNLIRNNKARIVNRNQLPN